jgi:hypothetical protein
VLVDRTHFLLQYHFAGLIRIASTSATFFEHRPKTPKKISSRTLGTTLVQGCVHTCCSSCFHMLIRWHIYLGTNMRCPVWQAVINSLDFFAWVSCPVSFIHPKQLSCIYRACYFSLAGMFLQHWYTNVGVRRTRQKTHRQTTNLQG